MTTQHQPSSIDNVTIEYHDDFIKGPVKQAMKDAAAGSGDLWMVPIDEIHVKEGFNVRVQDEAYDRHIRWIAESIKTEGFYRDEPLGGFIVQTDDGPKVYVHAGHCRLAGAKLARSEGAEIDVVPMVIVDKSKNLEDLTVALVKTNSGKPLTSYEVAVVAKRLFGFGWSSSKIAERLGFTTPYVDSLLEVTGYPLKIREMIQSGQVSISMAVELVKSYGNKAVEQLQDASKVAETSGSKRITKKHLPGRKFESFVKRTGPRLYDATRAIRNDPGYDSLAPATRDLLNTLLDELSAKEAQLQSSSTQEPGSPETSDAGDDE